MQLYKYLKQKNVSPLDFSRLAGVTKQTIFNIISGTINTKNLRLETAIRVVYASNQEVDFTSLVGTENFKRIQKDLKNVERSN